MIQRNAVALRDYPKFAQAVLVVIVECNMGYPIADRIRGMLSRPDMRPIFILSRDPGKKGRAGVWTGETEKVLYGSTLERVLANGALSRAKTFVAPSSADSQRPERHWDELLKQMATFRRIVHEPTDETSQKFRVTLTGKGGGAKDDLVLALQMALYWGDDVRRDPVFLTMTEQAHWSLV